MGYYLIASGGDEYPAMYQAHDLYEAARAYMRGAGYSDQDDEITCISDLVGTYDGQSGVVWSGVGLTDEEAAEVEALMDQGEDVDMENYGRVSYLCSRPDDEADED